VKVPKLKEKEVYIEGKRELYILEPFVAYNANTKDAVIVERRSGDFRLVLNVSEKYDRNTPPKSELKDGQLTIIVKALPPVPVAESVNLGDEIVVDGHLDGSK